MATRIPTSESSVAANDPVISEETPLGQEFYDVDKRQSLELVIALVAPVGSGATTTYEKMAGLLHQTYGYDPVYIRLSSLITDHAIEVGEAIPPNLAVTDRIDKYQSVGNSLRAKFGEAYLADRAIEQIALEREKRGGYKEINGERVVVPVRRVYFIDSLKNPAELKRLRQVYKDLLWVYRFCA